MDVFASAHCSAPSWIEAASVCLSQLRGAWSRANLGFLYAADVFAPNLRGILQYLQDATGIVPWVGSVGMGVCGSGREYHEVPALSLMVARFPEGSFRVFDGVHSDLAGFLGQHQAWCEESQARFGIVHGDPRNPRLTELIARLAKVANDGFLVGGLTSARTRYLQVCGKVAEGGLSGVLFSPEVKVATTLTQSCAPFGSPHEVTDCDQNILVTLDHRPALDVFYEEIGDILSRDLNKAARFIAAALLVPGSDRRDYLVRNLVGVDLQNRLIAIGDQLEPGQWLQFCRRDPANARQDMERMLRELKERIPNPPRGAVYYSCLGRGRHMFGENSEELQLIRETFGDLPLTGFFCSGEISHNRLYGYTGVLTLFL